MTFMALRISPILIYVFGMIFTSNYVFYFILIILLVAADFWNVKNIAGRLLVGLRWWNETNEMGKTIWVFENADENRYINPIDSKMFWSLMYAIPAAWVVLAVFAVLKLQLLSLILVAIAISLSVTNTMAYNKCDKFGKANSLASGLLGSVSSTLFSSFNPFAKFTST
jgi:hypothetical protein